jgi:hypothetical protein
MSHAARRTLLRLALPIAALLPAAASSHAEASTPLDHPPIRFTYRLDDEAGQELSLLRAYLDAAVERPGPYNRYMGGVYGRWAKRPLFRLEWNGGSERAEIEGNADTSESNHREEPAPSSLSPQQATTDLAIQIRQLLATSDRPFFWASGTSPVSNGFQGLWTPREKPVIDWRCRRRPVLFIRHGSENDRFSLVRCNGAVEPGAVDRLSIIARPPEVPDPGELPDEPDPQAWEKGGEWLPRVKLVNPRLVWLLQKIADAFPFRAIYIYSGYRPHRDKASGQGHHSLHGDGRAMDIQVHGIPNEALFKLCRTLDDVGCGYYPNSKFVHVDVRKPGTGHAFWVDISGPSEPSRYVDSWPGVVERGALGWMVVPEAKGAPPQGPRPRTGSITMEPRAAPNPGALRAPDDRGMADTIRK